MVGSGRRRSWARVLSGVGGGTGASLEVEPGRDGTRRWAGPRAPLPWPVVRRPVQARSSWRVAARRLRPVPAVLAGPGQRRQQAVPLPRSRSPSWPAPSTCGTPASGRGRCPTSTSATSSRWRRWFWCLDALGRARLGRAAALAGHADVAWPSLGARWLFRQLGTGPGAGRSPARSSTSSRPTSSPSPPGSSVLLLPWAALPVARRADDAGHPRRATGARRLRSRSRAPARRAASTRPRSCSSAWRPLLWLAARGPSGARCDAVLARGRPRGRPQRRGVALVAGGTAPPGPLRAAGPAAHREPRAPWPSGRLPGDVLRGLGNWFFYGRDRLRASRSTRPRPTTATALVVVARPTPSRSWGSSPRLVLRWTHRTYFCLLVLVGTVVSVGAWPFDDPTPYGRAWKAFTTDTSLGLALRNSPRAVPLVVLGFAGAPRRGGGGDPPTHLEARAEPLSWPRSRWAPSCPCGRAATCRMGRTDPRTSPRTGAMRWPSSTRATTALESSSCRARPSPAYRWGNLVDPLTPGLTDRPYVAREVLPYGTPASVNLLDALDRRAQLGVLDPASIAPVARLFGVGTVSLRADLEQSERSFSPPPGPVWDALQPRPWPGRATHLRSAGRRRRRP